MMNTTHSSLAEAAAPAHAIRVFLAEDHHITLWGLQRLIAGQPCMEVVGSATSLAELLHDEAAAEADVILLDLDLDGEDAVAALASLRQRCPGHVLVLTAADDIDKHRAAMMKGARGVLHKSAPAQTILRAIEKVTAGEVWLHRALLGDVLGRLTDGTPATAARPADPNTKRIASLTTREREIVALMVCRASAKQIAVADELHMSEHTLRNHLTTIYGKLGVRGRLELHVFASKHGLRMTEHGRFDA
jgi:DNA-binding NarL/FixJ family response regulator